MPNTDINALQIDNTGMNTTETNRRTISMYTGSKDNDFDSSLERIGPVDAEI
jgi:hypothetical protein